MRSGERRAAEPLSLALAARFGPGELPLPLLIGAGMVLFWSALALFADVIAPFDPNAADYDAALVPPNAAHWLGTDNFGRDVLPRVIHGTRADPVLERRADLHEPGDYEIQRIAMEDSVMFDLYYSPFRNISRTNVESFYQNPLGRLMLEEVTVE